MDEEDLKVTQSLKVRKEELLCVIGRRLALEGT